MNGSTVGRPTQHCTRLVTNRAIRAIAAPNLGLNRRAHGPQCTDSAAISASFLLHIPQTGICRAWAFQLHFPLNSDASTKALSMKNSLKLLFTAFTIPLLFACGGGGGGGDTPTASLTFPLKQAVLAFNSQPVTLNFTASGSITNATMNNTSIGGSGTITTSSFTSAAFEGASALKQTSTTTGTLSLNGGATPLNTSTVYYYDTNYNPLGSQGSDYEVVGQFNALPTSVKVGESGPYVAENIYTNSSKATLTTTRTTTYAVETDATTSALVRMTSTEKNVSGTTLSVTTTTFRITTDGKLTLLSQSGTDTSNGTLNLTLTFAK